MIAGNSCSVQLPVILARTRNTLGTIDDKDIAASRCVGRGGKVADYRTEAAQTLETS
ncbi:hypothetical protein WN48_08882 [Eufriesea mexicana]|uniref:Uncharacterized protein n=1 Tax=Eufriesea mexicana TaxID=516756 RepID=A0A310SQC8_9HYME|nr:hypothetical protein WN48_08882 [Eufriesea mexicana]